MGKNTKYNPIFLRYILKFIYTNICCSNPFLSCFKCSIISFSVYIFSSNYDRKSAIFYCSFRQGSRNLKFATCSKLKLGCAPTVIFL